MNHKDKTLNPPGSWPALAQSVEIIRKMSAQGVKITIWGHDDLDGIASTAIMLDALGKMAEVNYYIPPKNGVHYGLDARIIDRLIADGTGLIITVDGGISNYSEAEYCREKGLPLIITDHHELPEKLPPAPAVINPKIQDPGAPYAHLCGAGVAFYLAAGLDGSSDDRWHLNNARRLVWAALATISDRVPLLEENRTMVKEGFKLIPDDPVLSKLNRIIGTDLSRGLSPQIVQNSYNSLLSASKSTGHSHPMVELLMGKFDPEEIKVIWRGQNEWRQRLEGELKDKLSRLASDESGIIVLVDRELPGDMIGPLAGGIRDALKLPAVVIGRKGDSLVGEVRGYLPFDFVEMLAGLKDNFVQYGGHKQAAGFTLKSDALAGFLRLVGDYSARNRDLIERSRPEFKHDYSFSDLAQFEHRVSDINANGPYGAGNPAPNCSIQNVRMPDGSKSGQTYWLDDLKSCQNDHALKITNISSMLDSTSLGQISLKLMELQYK
jgi:single-stranded-DNA-specific exonuclease